MPTAWGGLGGSTIHPLSVGNVSKLVSLLHSPARLKRPESEGIQDSKDGIVVIGVGGINSGKTLQHFLSLGAVAGELCTGLGIEGISIFERICLEADILP